MSGMKSLRTAGGYLLLVVFGLAGVAGSIAVFQLWLVWHLPGDVSGRSHHLTIDPGLNVPAIARLLQQKGAIRNAREFDLLCRWYGAGRKLQAGEYLFEPLATPLAIYDKLVEGKVLLHRVTVPEGDTMYDVARILHQTGLASEQAVLHLAQDKDYIRSLHLKVSSLEGYLFPDTYYFAKMQSVGAMLRTMVHQFRLHFPESWRQRAKKEGMSVQDVVILASMVAKEAKVDSERPIIAAVFLNRLKKNMPLQCDPTAVYGMPGFSGPVTAQDLKRQSPYNTYLHRGLPIGPICNPGVKSLHAVLYPARVPYLYFVNDGNGTHHFSVTLAEHRKAVARYREKVRELAKDKAGG